MALEDDLRDGLGRVVGETPRPDLVASVTRSLPERPVGSSLLNGFFMRAGGAVAALVVIVIVGVAVASVQRPQPTRFPAAAASLVPSVPTSPSPALATAAATTATHTPSPIASDLNTAMPNASEPPKSAITGLEASNVFWYGLSSGEWGPPFDSTRAISSSADLIVIGTVDSVAFGERVGSFEVTRATIRLVDVLKGTPETQSNGTISLQMLPAVNREEIEQNIPREPSLMFLWFVPYYMQRLGESANPAEMNDYVLVNGREGLVRSVEGVARTLDPDGAYEYFSAKYEGQSFDDVVAAVQSTLN